MQARVMFAEARLFHHARCLLELVGCSLTAVQVRKVIQWGLMRLLRLPSMTAEVSRWIG